MHRQGKGKEEDIIITHPKLHHQGINDGADHSDEVKNVPWIPEKILGKNKWKVSTPCVQGPT